MNPDLICVATVTNVIGNHFLVHFDEWDDSYDYWCGDDCPYIRPVGWCRENNRNLNPPNGKSVGGKAGNAIHKFSFIFPLSDLR